MIDSQSVKTTEIGGPERGYDGGKQVSGRKRHVAVDMMGLLLGVAVTAASADDGKPASEVLWPLDETEKFPRLRVVYADQKYENQTAKGWLAARGDPFRLEIVRRPEGSEGFVKLPKRWVAEPGVAGPGSSAQQGLRADAAVERGMGPDQLDRGDVAASVAGREATEDPIQISSKSSGVASRIVSN